MILSTLGFVLNKYYTLKNSKFIIGRFDKVDLPDLQIFDIECKTDTGAYSCAIHTEKLRVIEIEGSEFLEAIISNGKDQKAKMLFSEFKQKKVKNSFGKAETRFLVKTRIKAFGKSFLTDISLSNRKNLRFPLLLGRKFLKKGFIVDVSLKDQSYNQKTRTDQ